MFCQMSYGGSFWSPKSIGSSSIKWEASEISSNRKSRCLCSFSEKEGSSHQGSSDAACVPSLEYRNSLRRVAAKLASICTLQSDIIQFPNEESDSFYGESSPSPDQADDRLSQFRLRSFEFVDRISEDPSLKEQSGSVSRKRRRRCLFSESAAYDDQRSDKSRARPLAETCSTPLTAAPQTRAQVPKISQFVSLGRSLPNYSSCFVTGDILRCYFN